MKDEIIVFDKCLTDLKDSNEEAIKLLYLELKRPIFILALSIVNDYFIAEDVLQETFIKVIKHACEYKEGTNAKAWIFMIAKNTALNSIKKRNREEIKEELIVKDSSDFTEDVNATIEFLRLIEPLEQEEREIVALRLSAGLSHSQIADILNISVFSARKRYSRAIKKLRENSIGGENQYV